MRGFPREPLKIIEICNARYANEMLKKDIRTALLLPCPIAVFTENGKTCISTMLPSRMADFFPEKDISGTAAQVQILSRFRLLLQMRFRKKQATSERLAQGGVMHKQIIFIATVLALAPAAAFAQRPGGSGQGGRPAGQGQPQQQGPPGGRGQRGTMDQDRDRDRLHSLATAQQRDQHRSCDQAMDRVRTHARDMARSAARKGFQAEKTRGDRDRLREHVRNLEQEHERMMQGLNKEQQAAIRTRSREMERTRERVNNHLRVLDEELAKDFPDRNRVREHLRSLEREMKEWQKHHRRTGDDLGLKT